MPDAEGKRAAPISASALSFSLAKKPRNVPPLPPPPPPPPPPKSPQPNARPITSHSLTPTGSKPGQSPSSGLGPLPPPLWLSPSGPQRRGKHRNRDRDGLTALTALPHLGVAEVANARATEIGVSPGKKVVYHGHGPPPWSVRLSNLVSGSSTALVLFYTSVHLGGQVAQAIARAPIRLRVGRVVTAPGPAVMAECIVLAWPGSGSGGSMPSTVLAVLQAMPAGCPGVGVDARCLDTLDTVHEIGVLAWSEGSLPSEESEVVVVFASRYLVSESCII
ncbi:hypothetical protein CspeluHIS016_0109890 [Cutaneotrichosporon spelunceum]|uniref:Uncharacterized protein n=1 Tax=Cutaneotrichosporon spelunceum TaxID=1672016 RepID=A0AAD3TP15_9TREE|nr:hypothetical protein CspeluHIS016_0109890 [Cutaneotrichosporon spelunceum]